MKKKILLLVFLLIFKVGGVANAEYEGSPDNKNKIIDGTRYFLLGWDLLKIGMSQDEVLCLVGCPYGTDTYKTESGVHEYWWWRGGNRMIRFRNGIIKSISN